MTATYPPTDGTQPCAGNLPLFFPKSGGDSNARAKATCRSCPFQAACLEYALGYQLYGIWGGTTQKERRQLQRLRGITPETVGAPRVAN